MKLYEITEEFQTIVTLIDSAIDENGEPRELNEEEQSIIKEFFKENSKHLEEKADAYGKIYSNFKLMAENAKSEKDNFKAEFDRLSNRAKVYTNRQELLKNNLFWAMNLSGKEQIKTSLFSFNIQNKPMSINTDKANIASLPDIFLKKEISKSAIQDAIKKGDVEVLESGSLIYKKTGELLDGIKAEKNKTLVIR